MNQGEKKPKTIKLSIIISLTISIILIIIITYFTFDKDTLKYLTTTDIRYEFFVLAIAVNIIYYMFWGLRIKILSNSVDKNLNIGLWKSTKIVLANMFLANITPSMAGGEPVRIYLLNKEGLSMGSATAAVLGERLLDAIFLLICVPFAIIIFRNNIEMQLLKTGLTIAVIIFLGAVAVFAYTIKYPDKMKSFLIYINKKFRRFSKKKESESNAISRISQEVDNFHNSMVFYLTKGKKPFVLALIITAVFWAVGWIIPILILKGLGLPPHVIESSAAQVLLVIIAMMPTTPGSTGVSEAGATGLYTVFIPQYLVGVFVILFRISTYYVGLIVGAIFQYKEFKSIASFSLDSIKKQEEK